MFIKALTTFVSPTILNFHNKLMKASTFIQNSINRTKRNKT
ncbi:hypothetical protein BVRB_4g097110 [Beta vulgaris subsp. vulgaris]|uniref:Uncharacterized protein n=1 Tax=Beta vulgaris subsp. vulgaris TaxID=3555 RepID=A0A0J8E4A4_BETVV|nr:hypothetical protein BVRB_4g097110 [Beta vulgaris subsp. vulgaris]